MTDILTSRNDTVSLAPHSGTRHGMVDCSATTAGKP